MQPHRFLKRSEVSLSTLKNITVGLKDPADLLIDIKNPRVV